MKDGRALKSDLPRTWGAFFGRHGNFTAAAVAAIPPILAGENVLLCAPTASGKTEAALAPLIERHLPAPARAPALAILYLLADARLDQRRGWRALPCPWRRCVFPGAVKTHDANTFDPQRPADLLLTTPESLDALLASQTKALDGCARSGD